VGIIWCTGGRNLKACIFHSLCESAIHITDRHRNILLACPQVLFSMDHPCASTIAGWVHSRIANEPDNVTLHDGLLESISVVMGSDVVGFWRRNEASDQGPGVMWW